MDSLVATYGLISDIKLYEEKSEEFSTSGKRRRSTSSSASSSIKAKSELEFEIPDTENAALKANFNGDLDDIGDAISQERR